MGIDEANLMNLMSLWKKYGARLINQNKFPALYSNIGWPHRCWFTLGEDHLIADHADDFSWLAALPEPVIIPVWPTTSRLEKKLREEQWVCVFNQLAMYLPLDARTTHLPPKRPGFQVMPVRSPEDVKRWVDIGSEAFAYPIDHKVIAYVLDDLDIRLLIGWQDEQAVASALLYKTGNILGVHQFAVKPDFQGQGIARSFMQALIAMSASWRGKYVVLQASQAGQPLYESLGFAEQFVINNYQKIRA